MAYNSTLTTTILIFFCAIAAEGKPTGNVTTTQTEEVDSYAVIPSKQQPQEDIDADHPLTLELVPPSVIQSSPPHIYYMGADGVAQLAEGEQIQVPSNARQFKKRSTDDNEIMDTDQTIIIRPASRSGHPFGYSPFIFSLRPSQKYARRWHSKYPWNYHRR